MANVKNVPLSIYLTKNMVVELKEDLETRDEVLKKGTVGIVVKGGKTQTIKFLNEKGEAKSFNYDFTTLVTYSDKKFESDNIVALEHGMKVEFKEGFKVGKVKFNKGAIGIVIKDDPAKQRMMIEDENGWYQEIAGDFTEMVNILNKK